MGDPAGIGPDIILAAHSNSAAAGTDLPPFIVFGDPAVFRDRSIALQNPVPIAEIELEPNALTRLAPHALPVVPIPCAIPVVAGSPDSQNGQTVIACIDRATAAVAAGTLSGLVTAPISKATVYGAGFAYPGHTEYLAALAERHFPGRTYQSVMMIASDVLRVVPLTIHVPLADVPRLITPDLITSTIEIVAEALKLDFAIDRPRIAVAGLNPHAGEGGSIGREELEVITPALDALRAHGLNINGPLSGDTLFHAAARSTYDAVVCMYHDQALIPIKTLAFDTGVNVTLGLPFVRTSPDHGTAFAIAGTGKASAASFVAALRLGRTLARGRLRHH
jgi:4-hydroxythreonine-4-phosphate dehydrogenase